MSTTIEKAKVRLMLKHPFFGSILLRRPMEATDEIPTACVTAEGAIKYNPDFVESMEFDQLLFLLAHEAMHVALAHLPRMKNRDHKLWNVACDAVINDLLEHEGIGRPIIGGVRMRGAKDRTAEEIYEELKQKPPQAQSGSGSSGNGQGDSTQGKGQSAAGTEDLRKEELDKYATDADVSQAIAEAKQELAQAAQGARLSGKLSGPVSQLVDKTLSTKVPWRSVLERFMTSKADQRRSWTRPNKRYMPKHYLPRRERLPAMGKLVVGIDVSGSVTEDEIAQCLGAVNEIVEVCPPEEIYVVYATTCVEHVDHYMRDDYPIKPEPYGSRGGTDLRCIMKWIEKEVVDADLCVVFTDGCTRFPESLPCETVWAITYRGVTSVPIGEYLEVSNE